ncbi:PTB/PI domain,PH domain-like [Cinara cedri]|uniref:PTB/PI domain,PH domain-like n=1 Tax=Cinara cedri TaxID=506608 RepID=A0A5E4MZH2_9HEMI|nr:PTB/PI domain,PH domain-like [Cinara cedri]
MSMMMMRPSDSTPICRCRVLYLGSAVPHITKDGLQGIQEPLKELYPEQGALGARGIDSWLSVWSNGLLLENVDENHKKITRFFPIESLHYCAAVRFVLVPEKSNNSSQPRFLPLDSPFARSPNPNHPPLFAAILRRTSGIKVLECHTFICKREMAANALVRCCFHAYADSSYAKQSDNGTNGGGGGGTAGNSIYGTVRTNRSMGNNTIEKVEGWRRMTNGAAATGSTLTLNSAHSNGITMLEASTNSIDDLSECNGDENHKVWVGSTKDISEKEDLYGGNTMRSSRSARPRQLVGGSAPPPPPPPPVRDDKMSKKNKERPRRKRTPTGGSREDLYAPSLNGSLMRPMNGGRSSVSLNGTIVSRGPPRGFGQPPPPPPPNHIYSNGGSMLRPVNGYHPHPHHHHPGMMQQPPPPPPPPPIMMVPTTLPHPKKMHKMKPGMMPMPRPNMIPANFMPVPMYIHTGGKKSKHGIPMPMPMAMEEPIYMPSTRPLSPVASYQPEHFPHEAYLMQQYAHNNNVPVTKSKKGKKDKKSKDPMNGAGVMPLMPPQMAMNGGGGMMMQQPPPPLPPPQIAVNGHRVNGNGMMSGHDETDDTEDSVYNTGIYRRKGHLNERAFSYSIRQEHRSRSYGSLANLKFAAPPIVPNGVSDGVPNKVDIKKEREIMQMMQDLELSGDELDRADQVVHQKQMHHQRPVKTKR